MKQLVFIQSYHYLNNGYDMPFNTIGPPKTIIKMSNGIIFNCLHKTYIATCYHSIINAYKIDVMINQKKIYTASIIAKCKEFDLTILETTVPNKNIISRDVLFEKKIVSNKDLVMKYINVNKKIFDNKIEIDVVTSQIDNLSFEHGDSYNDIIVPYYNIKISESFDFEMDLGGISGSAVYCDDKIIGIMTSINKVTQLFKVVPSICITRLLNEIEQTSKFRGLCSFVFDYDKYNVTADNGTTYDGFVVTNNYKIKYNDNKTNNINNKDILISFDDKIIANKNYVYDETANILLPFSTFISLNYFDSSLIKIRLFRESLKIKDDYDLIYIHIKMKTINSMRVIKTFDDSFNVVDINGLIFMQLTEELIDQYERHNIKLHDNIKKYYKEKNKSILTDKNQNIIVITNIKRRMMSNKIISKIDNYGLPLIHMDSDENDNTFTYVLPIVTKVNDKKIEDMSDLGQKINKIDLRIDKNISIYLENGVITGIN